MDWLSASWPNVGLTVLSAAAMYVVMLLGTRLAGRRTLATMSAFDALVTVALGTTLATTALSADPPLPQGFALIGTLLALQVALAHVCRRWPRTRAVIDFEPRDVIRDGDFVERNLARMQLSRPDVLSKLRQQGIDRSEDVERAVMEPTGELSVLRRWDSSERGRDHRPPRFDAS